MIWKDEVEIIDKLRATLVNLGADVSKILTQLESRKTTLENQINQLEADYAVLLARNEDARKESQKILRLDIERLEESKRRVQQRELALIEKEKKIRQIKAELETAVSALRNSRVSV